MEAAAEGAVGLSEARDGSPLSASDDGDTVVGVSYGMDAADMGTWTPVTRSPLRLRCVCSVVPASLVTCPTPPPRPKVPTHLC